MSELIVAVATPRGKGAIAVLRLSGDGALSAAQGLLDPGVRLLARRATVARALDRGRALDRVLATYFPAGASYTGEETVEISSHASAYVLERLTALCKEAGARDAHPGEFTQRAYLNGRIDLAQAEAVCDLIAARTEEAHRAAMTSLEGGLSERVLSLRAGILDLTAAVEANLDHPDEDIPPLADPDAALRLDQLLSGLDSLASAHRRGRLARGGARVAIVGLPNAGKSSLLNALLGTDRAIVSEAPGTTRDTIEESSDIAGVETVLIDTAGLRDEAAGPAEREGHARARSALRSADLALVVLDRTRELRESRALLDEVRAGPAKLIAVLNKSDLSPALVKGSDIGEVPAIEISALTGAGLEPLVREIRGVLAAESGEDFAPVVSARSASALDGARAELAQARALLGSRASGWEIIALHLRAALHALDVITGRTASDDVINEVFKKFCVGK